MPTRKKPALAAQKVETPEIIFLALPLVCLGLILLFVFLNGQAASGKLPANPSATVQAALSTPTSIPTVNTQTSASVSPTNPTLTGEPATASTPITTVNITTGVVSTGVTASPAPTVFGSPGGVIQTVRPGSPTGNGIRLTNSEAGLKFDLLVSPGHIGDNTYSLLLSENGNQAVTDASLVRLSVTSLEMDMGVATLDLTPAGNDQPGLYAGLDSKLRMLSMFGKYNIALLVRRPGHSDATTSFQLMVTGS